MKKTANGGFFVGRDGQTTGYRAQRAKNAHVIKSMILTIEFIFKIS